MLLVSRYDDCRCFGDGLFCLMNAYFSLFFPVGHSHAVAAKPGFIMANIGKNSNTVAAKPGFITANIGKNSHAVAAKPGFITATISVAEPVLFLTSSGSRYFFFTSSGSSSY